MDIVINFYQFIEISVPPQIYSLEIKVQPYFLMVSYDPYYGGLRTIYLFLKGVFLQSVGVYGREMANQGL